MTSMSLPSDSGISTVKKSGKTLQVNYESGNTYLAIASSPRTLLLQENIAI